MGIKDILYRHVKDHYIGWITSGAFLLLLLYLRLSESEFKHMILNYIYDPIYYKEMLYICAIVSLIPFVLDIAPHLFGKKTKAVKRLWELRESGAHLRNRHIYIADASEYLIWNDKYEKWREELLTECGKISNNLRNWNEIVNVMKISEMPPFGSKFVYEEFIINYHIICENLNRIERYLVSEFFKRDW